MNNKKTYIAPELVEFGSVEELTHGGKAGSALDKSFPQGTPFTQLTFS